MAIEPQSSAAPEPGETEIAAAFAAVGVRSTEARLLAAAKDACESAGGSFAVACEKLWQRIADDRALLVALMDRRYRERRCAYWIRRGAQALRGGGGGDFPPCGSLKLSEPTAVVDGKGAPPTRRRGKQARAAARWSGNAVIARCETELNRRWQDWTEAEITTLKRRRVVDARFLTELAHNLTPGMSAGDCITEDELDGMAERAERWNHE